MQNNNKLKLMMTHKDITIVSAAAIAVTICFGLMAGLVGNLQQNLVFAQEDIIEEVINETTAGIPTPTPESATESFLAQINGTIIAISGLMATAIGIVTGVVSWLRAKFGDKVISNDTNEWLQSIFEQVKQKDFELRDVFRQVLEKHAEIDTVVSVVKSTNPELATKIDGAMPKISSKLGEIQRQVEEWQKQADELYRVSPKSDPVKG